MKKQCQQCNYAIKRFRCSKRLKDVDHDMTCDYWEETTALSEIEQLKKQNQALRQGLYDAINLITKHHDAEIIKKLDKIKWGEQCPVCQYTLSDLYTILAEN